MSNISPTVAPNLPLPTEQYSSQAALMQSNALRLYFNTIDNFSQQTVQLEHSATVLAWMAL